MNSEVNDLLNQPSGSKYPSFKFVNVGDTIAGTIVDEPEVITMAPLDRKTADQPDDVFIRLYVQPSGTTDEDDRVAVWVKKGWQMSAVAAAVRAAEAPGLLPGGRIALKWSETKPSKFPNPLRLYAATYKPPAPVAVGLDDLL